MCPARIDLQDSDLEEELMDIENDLVEDKWLEEKFYGTRISPEFFLWLTGASLGALIWILFI